MLIPEQLKINNLSRRYSNTLNMLEVGDRVWANISGTGYVGIAEVIGDISIAENYQFSEFENKTHNKHPRGKPFC